MLVLSSSCRVGMISPIVQIRKLRIREASEALKVTGLEGAELGFQAHLIAKAGFFFLPF